MFQNPMMAANERTKSVQSYIEKFHHLWQNGEECTLTLNARKKSAWINLQVNLGNFSDGIPNPGNQSSRRSSRTRNGPSQQRRRARRAQARSLGKSEGGNAGGPNLPQQGSVTVKAAAPSYANVVASGLETVLTDLSENSSAGLESATTGLVPVAANRNTDSFHHGSNTNTVNLLSETNSAGLKSATNGLVPVAAYRNTDGNHHQDGSNTNNVDLFEKMDVEPNKRSKRKRNRAKKAVTQKHGDSAETLEFNLFSTARADNGSFISDVDQRSTEQMVLSNKASGETQKSGLAVNLKFDLAGTAGDDNGTSIAGVNRQSTEQVKDRKNKMTNLSVIKLPNLSIFSVAGEAKDQQMQTNWQEGVLTDKDLERIRMKHVEIDPQFNEEWLHTGLSDVVTAKIIGDMAYKRVLDALGESQLFIGLNKKAKSDHSWEETGKMISRNCDKYNDDYPGDEKLAAKEYDSAGVFRKWQKSIDKWAQEFVEQRNVSKNLSFA